VRQWPRSNDPWALYRILTEMYAAVVREPKRQVRANPKTGKRRSLCKIAAELAKIGEALTATGTPGAMEAARANVASAV